MGFGFFRKKDDSVLIDDAKEKFLKNLINYFSWNRTDEEQYYMIVKKTLENNVEEFYVNDGAVMASLGYSGTNFEKAEQCVHDILRDFPPERNSELQAVILMTISYLETVCSIHYDQFSKSITGRKSPEHWKNLFNNSLDFYKTWQVLVDSEDIVHLENFSKKYLGNTNREEVNKLYELILHKGHQLRSDMIRRIVEQFQQMLLRDRLTINIEQTNPKTLTDYLNAYLEIVGEKYDENITSLKGVLKKKCIQYEMNIRDLVIERKKTIEMDNYANSLTEPIKKNRYSIHAIDHMDGIEFEHFLCHLFEKMGYDVEVTPASGDQGADLIISKLGQKTVVQAKQYSQKVTNSAVQEITAAIKHYRALDGMVVTSNDFQQSAIELANSNGVELINREKLSDWINDYL